MTQNTTETNEYGWIELGRCSYQPLMVNVFNIDNLNFLVISKSVVADFSVNLFDFKKKWESFFPKYPANYHSTSRGIIAATLDKETQTLYILSKVRGIIAASLLLCMNFNELRLRNTIEPQRFYLEGPCDDVTEILFENGRLHAITHLSYLMWDISNAQTNSKLPICVHNHITKKNTHLLYVNNQQKVLLYENGGVHQLKINQNSENDENNTNNINNTNIDKNNSINKTNNHSNNNTNNNNSDDTKDNKDEINSENLALMKNPQYNQKWCLLTKFRYKKQFYPVIVTDCGRYVLNFCASRNYIRIHDIINHQIFVSEIYCPSIAATPRFATYLHDKNQDFITTNAYIHDCYSNISFKLVPRLPEYLIKFICKFVAIEFVHLFYDGYVRKNVNYCDTHWRIKLDTIFENAKPFDTVKKQ